MSTPKFKEHPYDRSDRLNLGKVHIYWSKELGEWLARNGSEKEDRYCIAQDARWTPRDKS